MMQRIEIDRVQQQLTEFACTVAYEQLPPEVVHAAKTRIIYALGALIAGFSGEPCKKLREVALQFSVKNGAPLIGTV